MGVDSAVYFHVCSGAIIPLLFNKLMVIISTMKVDALIMYANRSPSSYCDIEVFGFQCYVYFSLLLEYSTVTI